MNIFVKFTKVGEGVNIEKTVMELYLKLGSIIRAQRDFKNANIEKRHSRNTYLYTKTNVETASAYTTRPQ
jgi:hypothetical protein